MEGVRPVDGGETHPAPIALSEVVVHIPAGAATRPATVAPAAVQADLPGAALQGAGHVGPAVDGAVVDAACEAVSPTEIVVPLSSRLRPEAEVRQGLLTDIRLGAGPFGRTVLRRGDAVAVPTPFQGAFGRVPPDTLNDAGPQVGDGA